MNIYDIIILAILCIGIVYYVYNDGQKLWREHENPDIKQTTCDFYRKHIFFLHPNVICWYRGILGLPCAYYLDAAIRYEIIWMHYILVPLIALLSIGDYLDGMVARSLNLTSPKGAKLDALTDKLFYLPILYVIINVQVSITDYETLLIIFFWLITTFDGIGTFLRSKMQDPAAVFIGKCKTFSIFINLGIFYFRTVFDSFQEFELIFVVLFAVSAILAVASAVKKINFKNIRVI
jgi:phosphatidylglycerophosphate synthase